jgi:hypothetical protein
VNSLAQHCPQLQVLELGCNDLTPSGAKRMAPAIAAMRQLRKLNLSENELGDKGIWDVGAALMQCPCVPLPFTRSVALAVPNQNLCRGSTEASLRLSPHQWCTSRRYAPQFSGLVQGTDAHTPQAAASRGDVATLWPAPQSTSPRRCSQSMASRQLFEHDQAGTDRRAQP